MVGECRESLAGRGELSAPLSPVDEQAQQRDRMDGASSQ